MKDMVTWFQSNKIKIAKTLFYIALSLELVVMMVGHSAFELPYRGRITHIAFVLFGCKLLLTPCSKKEWVAIIFLGIIGTISYVTIRDEWVIRIVMMVVASKNMDLKSIAKYIFWVSLIGTVIIIGLSLLGVGGQMVDIRDYGRGKVETRWCLGFNHANNVHGTIWYVVSLGMYAYLNKTRWYHYLLLTIMNIGLYTLTVSRTGLLLTQIILIVAFLYRYYSKISAWKWVYIAGMPMTLFWAGIGIYAVYIGNSFSPALKALSKLLTDRLELLYWWEKVEYWNLFGSTRERVPVDVGYITMVARYGYVILGLYVISILLLVWYYYKNQRWMEFMILMACVFYTFMESTYTVNVPLLCNFTFVLLLGTWNHLLTKGRNDESVQSKIQVN